MVPSLPTLLLLACTGDAEEPCPPGSYRADDGLCTLIDTGGASDGGASDGGASDGGASDGGASDGGASDGGADEPFVSTGDCWVEEGPPPEDHALGDEYWALPAYIAGTDRRFASIQDAIWGAEEGDTVVVKAGTYTGTVDLVGKVITLCSEEGPATTVIDADGEGPAVRLRNWEPPETLVQGFTITGGVGEGDDTFGPTPHGGGVFVEWGSPTVRHNLIIDNQAQIGGGVYVRNGAATVENNIIAWNHADQGGGGLTCSACQGRIAYNDFAYNDCPEGPLAEYFWGAADFVGNLVLLPEGTTAAIRWMEPRDDVDWTGGPNLMWPWAELLLDAPEDEWPDLDTWRFDDPGLTVDPAAPTAGWQLSDTSPAVDAGPADDTDADGSPADLGAFGGPHGDWSLGG